MTEEEFIQILGIQLEALPSTGSGPWLHTLARAYSGDFNTGGNWGELSRIPQAGFLKLVEPLMADARSRLQSRAAKIGSCNAPAPFDSCRAVDALFANLPARLLQIIAKTMVLELQVARVQGLLQGTTPAERFASFTQRLSDRQAALELFSEYPVLARRLTIAAENWLNFSAEFLEHLAADSSRLAKMFTEGDLGNLVEASAGAGDTHRCGRSVILARFESGVRLVYKPRSLAIDQHFQQFIRWLNESGAYPQLRELKILNCKDHGWAEFVQTGPCNSRAEVERFYERQGEYLAILYVLQATDFHFENLLACGEDPVLVDLEALFHPWVRALDVEQPDVRLLATAQIRSVLRTGLLPRRTAAHGMELSGLGGAPGQTTELLQWVSEGTDEMAAVKQPFRMPGAQNRPSIAGADIDLRDYTEQIIAGFSRMYDLLCSQKRDLLSGSGPLAAFAQDEVRIVVRATRGYGVLLSQSLHPDYLRDALDLDRLLDRLWAGVEHNSHLLRVLSAERRDLMRGDIPIFTTRPDSTDVFSSDGERITNFLPQSGMSLSRETIAGLSPEDRDRQAWLIRASIATLDLAANDMTRSSYEPVSPPSPLRDGELRARLMEEACRIGSRLAELALAEKDNATWIGFAKVNKIWSLDALHEDLYAGSPGVILALAYLGSFGFEEHTHLARRALNTLKARLENKRDRIRSIGAFDGWSGVIYMLSHLASLWHDAELVHYAGSIVDRLPALIEEDESLDVIGGCAGCIGALLALHSISPSHKALSAALQCGDRLLKRAHPVEHGIGWFIKNIETAKPITGFAHGASGIAWALLTLAAQTGHTKYSDAALQAIAYERGEYSTAVGNWAENAPGSEELTGPSMAWCYGAPGIGLARLAAIKITGDPLAREDLELAVQATLRHGLGANHCLCHGDLGNLDLLLQASIATGSSELSKSVNDWSNQILASMKRYGWLCGVPLRVESPALMNGLAGICYGLLRLAAPQRVPSVLTLAPASEPLFMAGS